MRCILLDIKMPIGQKCPSIYNLDGFNCYKKCGFRETKKDLVKKRGEKKMGIKYVVIDIQDEEEPGKRKEKNRKGKDKEEKEKNKIL